MEGGGRAFNCADEPDLRQKQRMRIVFASWDGIMGSWEGKARGWRGGAGSVRLQRAPMKSDPEDILMRSGLGAATSIAFLHQNMLQFMPSIHEVADGLHYLSLAGMRPSLHQLWQLFWLGH